MGDWLRVVLDGVECGVVVATSGIVQHVNPALATLFGLPEDGAERWYGRSVRDLEAAMAQVAPDPTEFRSKLGVLAESAVEVSEDVLLRDGRILERDYLPVLSDGVRSGHLALYWDVTEFRADEFENARRQRAEIIAQQMGAHAQRTRAMEAERTGEQLAERNRALAEADEQRREMLATVSHELRTPLTSILSFSELLTDSTSISGTDRQFLEVINRNAQHLLQTVEDVLLLAGLAASTKPIAMVPVDLARLVTEAAEDLAATADNAGVDVRVVAPGPVELPGDRGSLARVLANVLGNAVKYTDPGGTVTARLRTAPGSALLEIADTGIGIPADELDRVFTQFYRASSARLSDRPGTGLGLAIAQSIVAQHGGTMAIRSREGVGTTVTVEVPR